MKGLYSVASATTVLIHEGLRCLDLRGGHLTGCSQSPLTGSYPPGLAVCLLRYKESRAHHSTSVVLLLAAQSLVHAHTDINCSSSPSSLPRPSSRRVRRPSPGQRGDSGHLVEAERGGAGVMVVVGEAPVGVCPARFPSPTPLTQVLRQLLLLPPHSS